MEGCDHDGYRLAPISIETIPMKDIAWLLSGVEFCIVTLIAWQKNKDRRNFKPRRESHGLIDPKERMIILA